MLIWVAVFSYSKSGSWLIIFGKVRIELPIIKMYQSGYM